MGAATRRQQTLEDFYGENQRPCSVAEGHVTVAKRRCRPAAAPPTPYMMPGPRGSISISISSSPSMSHFVNGGSEIPALSPASLARWTQPEQTINHILIPTVVNHQVFDLHSWWLYSLACPESYVLLLYLAIASNKPRVGYEESIVSRKYRSLTSAFHLYDILQLSTRIDVGNHQFCMIQR